MVPAVFDIDENHTRRIEWLDEGYIYSYVAEVLEVVGKSLYQIVDLLKMVGTVGIE